MYESPSLLGVSFDPFVKPNPATWINWINKAGYDVNVLVSVCMPLACIMGPRLTQTDIFVPLKHLHLCHPRQALILL